MKLYEIDQAIMNLVDPETGEITDFDALDALTMERTSKLEGIVLWYKNLTAEAAVYKAEKDVFAERERVASNKAARLKEYLARALDGSPLTTDRCKVTFRKTTSTQVSDENALRTWLEQNHDDLLQYQPPKYKKDDIAKLLKAGEPVPGAEIVTGLSMGVK